MKADPNKKLLEDLIAFLNTTEPDAPLVLKEDESKGELTLCWQNKIGKPPYQLFWVGGMPPEIRHSQILLSFGWCAVQLMHEAKQRQPQDFDEYGIGL